MTDKSLAEAEYNQFRLFLEQHSGIVLGENKQYLVRSRLAPLMGKYGLPSLNEVVKHAMKPTERQLRTEVIDAMTTNETLWFRDRYPFELLASALLPEFGRLGRPLKIWSAACSSGQEPYSLAMTILEYQQKRPGALPMGAAIQATDLSPSMLDRCRNAEYDNLALGRGLSEERKRQFFEALPGGNMRVRDNVRRMVNFRAHNLLESYALLGKFDIIFCRNVLIYFAPEAKAKILRQFAAALNPKGILFLGASESIAGLTDEFDMIRCNPGIYYQKRT
ncbi:MULTISPECIES: CheR family methyltransferase [Shewanella]|uniref:protein-glutamate O-methyltransferase n=2 Tax=Shewanella TaxID=22 RepID=A0A974XKL0_9GAMM|nr:MULTISPECIES: protein-glutamate O-methyltransferase CheR [Shewanella]QSX28973.1 protein-glutamate O-methyltransferase CheR [Shewanella cyperi]QSX36097.1 protein-glutamate O-methyltransferase CheR [Shewanella sedimentimangrovi]QSX39705.1 protein-glutamate O-methyltransferase CheR [Shewanella cyperi]